MQGLVQEVSRWDLLFWQGNVVLSPRFICRKGEVTTTVLGATSPNEEEKEFLDPQRLTIFHLTIISVPAVT